MEDKELVHRISERQENLRKTAIDLKNHFVGIDPVIDKVVMSIEAWYCMPELCTRPTIVCLWGLTGIGKTDLVRRLVKSLNLVDNFVEIQLTNKGSSSNTYATTLQGLLTSSNVSSEEPGILLLDEIQRFRSLDEEGNEIHDYYFQDLWMLLSDGSFGSASDNKQRLFEILFEAAYYDDLAAAKKQAGVEDEDDDDFDEDEVKNQEVEKRRKFKQTYWSARQLKRQLRLNESIEEIMKWDGKKKLSILAQKMEDKSIYTPDIYSKLLIFISGNIDEAYKMADEAEETDTDADIFHKHSLRINLLSIKSALKERFKPEQIARFGNSHIVYPALDRRSYETIIQRKVAEVLRNVEEVSGVRLHVDASVYDAIYRNGVFPVQGTRPVFSTISSFFESALPSFTLRCLQSNVKETTLFYDDRCLTAMIGTEEIRVKNEGDIDKIKKEKKNKDQICKVAVHESGHAVVYGTLFGVVPTQVAVHVASEDKNGFIGIHSIDLSKEALLDQIATLLAGRAAEELAFGNSLASVGAWGDIDRATMLAANFVRMYAMGDSLSKIVTSGTVNSSVYSVNVAPTNDMIEKILQEQKQRAIDILKDKAFLLHDLADFLIDNEKIEPLKFKELFDKHETPVKILDAKETIYSDYSGHYASRQQKRREKD